MTTKPEAFDIGAAKRQCKRWLTDYDEYDPEVMHAKTRAWLAGALSKLPLELQIGDLRKAVEDCANERDAMLKAAAPSNKAQKEGELKDE